MQAHLTNKFNIMQNKTTVVIGILTLLIGLMFGYVIGDRASLSIENHNDEVMDTHSHEDSEMHNMMDMMMANLEGKTGESFERAFLEDIIVHHEGAVEMTRALLDETNRPELTQFAKNIIAVQSEEIEMMEGWLEEWYDIRHNES